MKSDPRKSRGKRGHDKGIRTTRANQLQKPARRRRRALLEWRSITFGFQEFEDGNRKSDHDQDRNEVKTEILSKFDINDLKDRWGLPHSCECDPSDYPNEDPQVALIKSGLTRELRDGTIVAATKVMFKAGPVAMLTWHRGRKPKGVRCSFEFDRTKNEWVWIDTLELFIYHTANPAPQEPNEVWFWNGGLEGRKRYITAAVRVLCQHDE
jgi:hypothetical protein